MIALPKSRSFTLADDFKDPPWTPTGHTGIPAVDSLLEPALERGGLVLVSGFTGAGKTVLAGQIAACAAYRKMPVTYVSGEIDEDEMLARMMSCMAGWPHQELKDGKITMLDLGNGYRMPQIQSSDDFSTRAAQPYRALQKFLSFHYRRGFQDDPVGVLDEFVSDCTGPTLILDPLQIAGINMNVPAIAAEVLEILQAYAHEYEVPVFVFCQRNTPGEGQSKMDIKNGRAGGISDFPSAERIADVTIEMTQPLSLPSERRESPGTFSDNRHFIIKTAGGGREKWIPVLADFDHQRFTGRNATKVEELMGDLEFRQRVLAGEQRKGYIRFPRDLWDELRGIGHLPSIALYVTMVINANPKTGLQGWSEDAFARCLGMSRSVIRRALGHLGDAGLINCVSESGKTRQCRKWEVVGYAERFQRRDASDYVVIARNLLDDSRACLRYDGNALLVWLHLLFATRFVRDDDGFLERGQWKADYGSLASELRIAPDELERVMQLLEDQKRIVRWTDPGWGMEVVKLPNYDPYQRQVPWRAR